MGKVEKTRFERNWTTFVNPAFCPAWKSPLKMMVWNRPSGIRFQGCFFVSPRWGKSKKRVLNAIGRRSSTRLFALLGKAHSKWWYETDLVEFDPKGVFRFAPMGKVEKTRFERNWTTFVNPAFCPAWKSPLKMVVWNRPRGNSILRVFFRFAPMGKVEKTRFERNWTTFVNPAFCPAWKSPLKMMVWNRPRGIRSQGCFFRFAPMGKVEKTRFERNWTTFVNPAFCPAWKSPLKMVVWNRPSGIRSQGCFFVSPRWGKSKKRVLNAIGRRSSTRLFALLGKAHSKWWYETDLVEFDPKGVFSFRPDGESRKNAFWTQLDDVRQPGFLPCLEKPTQNDGMKPTSWNSIPRVFFSFRPDGESRKNAFWTKLNDVRQPGFLPCLEKPTRNGGMKPTSWNSILRVFFSFRPDGESRKNAFWTQLDDVRQPGFLPCLEKPTQNDGMKPTSWNSIPRVFFSFRTDGESRKNAFWTQLDDVRQPSFLPCLEKPTQNGGMKPT